MVRAAHQRFLALCMLCGPMKGDSIDGGYDACMAAIRDHFVEHHANNGALKDWPPPPHSKTAAGVTWYRDPRGTEIFGIVPMLRN